MIAKLVTQSKKGEPKSARGSIFRESSLLIAAARILAAAVASSATAAAARPARSAARTALAVATLEDFRADVLPRGLDLLHLLPDARPGGFVPADRLGHVLLRLRHQPFQRFVFGHHDCRSPKSA